MAKEILEEQKSARIVEGETIKDSQGNDVLFYDYHVVRATPNAGGAEYIRLHLEDGSTYLWNAPVADWNNAVGGDPVAENRWEAE